VNGEWRGAEGGGGFVSLQRGCQNNAIPMHGCPDLNMTKGQMGSQKISRRMVGHIKGVRTPSYEYFLWKYYGLSNGKEF